MNKKWIFTATVIMSFLALSSVNAQIKGGFISGVNFSKYKLTYLDEQDESYYSTSRLMGFHAGLVFDVPFGGALGVQPSIMFSQKGNKLNFEKADPLYPETYQSKHNLNYVEVPILFKYRFGSEDAGFSLLAGPSLNFAIGGKMVESGKWVLYDNTTGQPFLGKVNQTIDVKVGDKVNNQFKAFDAGFMFGANGYFPVGDGNLVLEAKFYIGGTNIRNDKYDNTASYNTQTFEVKNYSVIHDRDIFSEIRNRSILLSVAYLHPLRRPH